MVFRCPQFGSSRHQEAPVRDLSVDIVITLYGMAAVLIYMMLIGDFMADIATRFGGS